MPESLPNYSFKTCEQPPPTDWLDSYRLSEEHYTDSQTVRRSEGSARLCTSVLSSAAISRKCHSHATHVPVKGGRFGGL